MAQFTFINFKDSTTMMTTTNTTVFKRMGRIHLVFDNVPDGRIFDGYAMAALFCGLSVLSGFMNNMICIGGCLTMLIFIVIKLAISMVIGIIALPISVAYNLYNIAKAGAVLVKSNF